MSALPDNSLEVMSGVIEAEPTVYSPLDWLTDYGRTGERPSDEVIAALVNEGYLFDRELANFTDKGFEVLEERGVAVKEINVLTLGTTLHIPMETADGKRTMLHLQKGSQTLVLFSNRLSSEYRKTGVLWFDVKAGDQLPVLRVYQNSQHKFSTHKWPATWPLNGTSITAP